MFNALKRIVLGLMLVILFAAGLYLLIPFMPSFLYERLSEYYYYEDEQGIFIAGLIMVLLPLFYLLFASWSHRKRADYTIKGKNGDSIISDASIYKSLVSAIKTIPTVVKVKPVIKYLNGSIQVTLVTYIRLDQYIPNICERIRQRAHSTLTGVLGIDRVEPIDVKIQDVHLSQPPLVERMRSGSQQPAGEASKSLEKTADKPAAAPKPMQAPKPPLPQKPLEKQ